MSLEPRELRELVDRIGREPTPTELQIVAAEWSEHCSYKSSRKHLGVLPMDGPAVVSGRGYDSGVLDVGGGYVVTAHIESHNHPSAVEPYGGAATGVGGVIRDILSTGTRPIAILDGLRFGDVESDPHARWLFRNAVAGIADYGNCLGVPTVGGEVEFDACYSGYALVDVAAVGFGRRENLIRNRAGEGDLVVLLGGHTGRDGIGGSQFASDPLESEDRSAVQIPDPFTEKLVIEAVLEARNARLIHAIKDLGGGGLSCAVSETADSLSVGMRMDVDMVHTREEGMRQEEIMVSESQERMLVITDREKLPALRAICDKFRVAASVIGTVTSDNTLHVTKGGATCARLPTGVVANATLLDRPSRRPSYLDGIGSGDGIGPPSDYAATLLRMLSAPNIASRIWVYGQYDHEVGIRTVVRPGGDASVLRLDNGRFLSVKIDGNPKHCYLDPREGAIGCFEEACRNVACTGAKPAGMLDHLQFGSPEDPEIFWTFLESVRGLADFARHLGIPCIGGKVSLYNETPAGPIKPTPLVGVLGLADRAHVPRAASPGDCIVAVGDTRDEMGGSEYFEYVHGFVGGRCPAVDFEESVRNMGAVIEAVGGGLAKNAHDCSKGGMAVAVSELCMAGGAGCDVSVGDVPGPGLGPDRAMFSESHSRYVLVAERGDLEPLLGLLRRSGAPHRLVGEFTGGGMRFREGGRDVADVGVGRARDAWLNSLGRLASRG